MLFSPYPFRASDNHQLHVYKSDVPNAKMNLLIVHGMAEHGARYERFAKAAAEKGIQIIVPDLRGHGRTSELNGQRGVFGEGGWKRVGEDVGELATQITNETNLPLYVLGHSMGSMVALTTIERGLIQPKGAILSALPPHPGALVYAGKVLSKIVSVFKDKNKPNHFMDKLTFGEFNKGIANAETSFDWLSRDQQEVKKYIDDPDCGEVFSTGFFGQLADLTDFAHKNLSKVDKTLPILYIAGNADPVVEKEKGTEKVIDAFQKHSSAFTAQIFHEARHELLNETNRDQVTAFVLDWIEQH
ncbi:alpha/beta fold hydrolase [Sanyastnella coralliicola]|uniref:alpha/beta fold hydrolase n=1 Tax=Sanyastnella coralliicola TaxID=3069118 RepID=UPI0027B8CF2D|nr:alpha/beta hydrolase [Longitalea sp. SCSIO 12813]